MVKKELNFIKQNIKIEIDHNKKLLLLDQIHKDCHFFVANNIIDYSLLLGIHYKKKKELQQLESESSLYSEIEPYQDTVSIIPSEMNDKIYYLGIIDIFTQFRYCQ